jgi:hypothetical protein
VPPAIRGIVIETYVQAIRVVFLMTVGFVLLNALCGAFLEEHTLHDNLERSTTQRVDGEESQESA